MHSDPRTHPDERVIDADDPYDEDFIWQDDAPFWPEDNMVQAINRADERGWLCTVCGFFRAVDNFARQG